MYNELYVKTYTNGKDKLTRPFFWYFNENDKTKGVYVYHDESGSGNSFQGLPGGDIDLFADGDWLIRAVVQQSGPITQSDKLAIRNVITTAKDFLRASEYRTLMKKNI